MKKKIYLFISFILVLFIACAAKEIKEEDNMESKVDKKLDVSKITYDKKNYCYHLKYKYVFYDLYRDFKLMLPIYNGIEGAGKLTDMSAYNRSFKDNRTKIPLYALCLPVQKGGYSTIMDVLEFYQKEGFIKDIGEMEAVMNNMWAQGDGSSRGALDLYSPYQNKSFVMSFYLHVPNFHKYKKYPIFTTPIYKKKLKDIMELIKDFEKLPYKNNTITYGISIDKQEDK